MGFGLLEDEVDDILMSGSLLRGLLRMKIADKNDIGTARFALVELRHFFKELSKRADAEGEDEWGVFTMLQH